MSEEVHVGNSAFPALLSRRRTVRVGDFLVTFLLLDEYSIASVTITLSPYTWILSRGLNLRIIRILLPIAKLFTNIVIS
jgi:hypothetical protein